MMQQPLSSIPPTDCLLMELTGMAAESGNPQQLDLYLSLHFDEAWQPLMGGQLKYGLTGGRLQLKIDNGKICQVSCQETPMIEQIVSKTDKSHSCRCQISFRTQETEPTWLFELDAPAPQSCLQNLPLGTLEFHSFPCKIQAIFEVDSSCVRFTGADGLWHHDISPNKHAILETKISLSLQEFQLVPRRQRVVVLQYNSAAEIPEISSYEICDPLSAPVQPLQQSMQKVLEAKTDDFLKLAALANLNPAEDFAGANMLGVTLENVDFSGANLAGANFRGALLNDVDLSGANLIGANFAGADLSGALLSDANLTNADLHRCSLALANLAGANLTNANLTGVNLSNSNLSDANLTGANLTDADLNHAGLALTKMAGAILSGAKVLGARFRHDAGISEEMHLDLKQRGAMFEEDLQKLDETAEDS